MNVDKIIFLIGLVVSFVQLFLDYIQLRFRLLIVATIIFLAILFVDISMPNYLYFLLLLLSSIALAISLIHNVLRQLKPVIDRKRRTKYEKHIKQYISQATVDELKDIYVDKIIVSLNREK